MSAGETDKPSVPTVTGSAKEKFVKYSVLIQIYDECSVDRFDELHAFFYTWYWLSSLLTIMLSTISGATSGPNLLRGEDSDRRVHDALSFVGLVTGILSACILSVEKIVDVHKIANECKWARGELQLYLKEKSDMPYKTFDQINKIGLMCFRHPQKCQPSEIQTRRLYR